MNVSELSMRLVRETWWLAAEMAPYLLLGFLISGLLRAFFTEEWVRRHLGQKGLYQIFKAVVIGIPLPLCSCGVIPVAAGIRRQGGQRGAVAAFTAATPQTGVDAIAATIGMLGWVFAAVRVVIAFINGIVAGLVVDKWADPNSQSQAQSPPPSCCSQNSQAQAEPQAPPPSSSLLSGLRFGFITLPRDLFGPLVLGFLIAGLIATFVPAEFFTGIPGGLVGIYLGMTLLSLPLYVCSTGSIPMAFTFLQSGLSPGAVLIFLIAGPATNAATVTSLWRMIGGRATIGYILSIIATSWVMAAILDLSGLSLLVVEAVHHHEMQVNLFQQLCAVVLIGIMLLAKLRSR